MKYTSINPSNGNEIGEYPLQTPEELTATVTKAGRAHNLLRAMPVDERQQMMFSAAKFLREDADTLAYLITREMGKPIREARAEVEKSATVCEYYGNCGAQLLAPQAIMHDVYDATIEFEPLGVIVAVMPWNYPVWQVMRAAAPGITAGNSLIVKHAANVTGSALKLEEILLRAGWPEGAFNIAVTDPAGVSALLAHEEVRGVTLTGGTVAGAAVARTAGEHVKKSVLELGGSDAFIVLEDADVRLAAKAAISGRFLNAGQSCIAAKRLLVHESVAEDFESELVRGASALVVGNPEDPKTDLGPLARKDLRDGLVELVNDSVGAGARLALGTPNEDEGAYLSPVILADVTPNMAVFTEETFGPVASITTFTSDAEAVALANKTQYGLSLAVWGNDVSRAMDVVSHIETGMAFINSFTASDPRMPFGGVKNSGYGRELGTLGITEFVNARTIAIKRNVGRNKR